MFHQSDSVYRGLPHEAPGSQAEGTPSSGGTVGQMAGGHERRTERRQTVRVRRWWALVAHLALAGLVATGCAKARAASIPQTLPLTVPEPPPRVLTPVEEAPLAASPGPDTSLASAPSLSPPPRPQRRAAPAASESNASESGPPAANPSSAPAAEVPRDIRPAPSSREPVADQQRVQGVIAQAERDLNRVDWGRLSAEGKEQYDLSARYRTEAATALKDRNFLRAGESAEKAARIAAALLKGQ